MDLILNGELQNLRRDVSTSARHCRMGVSASPTSRISCRARRLLLPQIMPRPRFPLHVETSPTNCRSPLRNLSSRACGCTSFPSANMSSRHHSLLSLQRPMSSSASSMPAFPRHESALQQMRLDLTERPCERSMREQNKRIGRLASNAASASELVDNAGQWWTLVALMDNCVS